MLNWTTSSIDQRWKSRKGEVKLVWKLVSAPVFKGTARLGFNAALIHHPNQTTAGYKAQSAFVVKLHDSTPQEQISPAAARLLLGKCLFNVMFTSLRRRLAEVWTLLRNNKRCFLDLHRQLLSQDASSTRADARLAGAAVRPYIL